MEEEEEEEVEAGLAVVAMEVTATRVGITKVEVTLHIVVVTPEVVDGRVEEAAGVGDGVEDPGTPRPTHTSRTPRGHCTKPPRTLQPSAIATSLTELRPLFPATRKHDCERMLANTTDCIRLCTNSDGQSRLRTNLWTRIESSEFSNKRIIF